MFTINVKADVHVHLVPDPETVAILKRLEGKVDRLVAALPGPAAKLTLIAGPVSEQKT